MDIKQRTNEIMKIFLKLKELNLGIMYFNEFNDFRSICNNFIRNGIPIKGEIKVLGTKRIIIYNFGDSVDCMLKYDETV